MAKTTARMKGRMPDKTLTRTLVKMKARTKGRMRVRIISRTTAKTRARTWRSVRSSPGSLALSVLSGSSAN